MSNSTDDAGNGSILQLTISDGKQSQILHSLDASLLKVRLENVERLRKVIEQHPVAPTTDPKICSCCGQPINLGYFHDSTIAPTVADLKKALSQIPKISI
jgi:hypothetical protein